MDRDAIGTIFAGLGILDTLYLMDATYNNSGACAETSGSFLGTPIDCGHILTSEYASVFGISLSFWGFLFYVSMFIMFNLYNSRRLYISKLLMIGSTIGLLASSYFVYLQFAVIERVCIYCMGSAFTSTSIFILMLISFKEMSTISD